MRAVLVIFGFAISIMPKAVGLHLDAYWQG